MSFCGIKRRNLKSMVEEIIRKDFSDDPISPAQVKKACLKLLRLMPNTNVGGVDEVDNFIADVIREFDKDLTQVVINHMKNMGSRELDRVEVALEIEKEQLSINAELKDIVRKANDDQFTEEEAARTRADIIRNNALEVHLEKSNMLERRRKSMDSHSTSTETQAVTSTEVKETQAASSEVI